MTELDKLKDKEQDITMVDQDTLNKVSGGDIYMAGCEECPKCHEWSYEIRSCSCLKCGYKWSPIPIH